ncbi:MAG: hypothetical protein HKP28_02000, partial [Winogradskyella sp.]|nr:hypothetical protein [Winogradskyella sp.]
MSKLRLSIALLSFCVLCTYAQQMSTEKSVVDNALKQKQAMTSSSLVKQIQFENIGPTIMSGRVV